VTISAVTKLMGLIVDALDEVYQINAEDIEPPPDFGKGTINSHIVNMAKAKGQVKALLDLDRIVEDDHVLLAPVPAVASAPTP
jgi:purine-binding chemotaxis protein CheW